MDLPLLGQQAPDRSAPVSRSRSRSKDLEAIAAQLRTIHPGLRFNQVSRSMESGPFSNPQDVEPPERLHLRLSEGSGHVYCKQYCTDYVSVCALKNSFNPVQRYLDHCLATTEPSPIFPHAATELLSDTKSPQHQCLVTTGPDKGRRVVDVILERFLIGAVARAIAPGCVHDWMLVLNGWTQHIQTLFLEHLIPPAGRQCGNQPWCNIVDYQCLSTVRRSGHLQKGWIVVYDDVRTCFARKNSRDIHAFLLSTTDRSMQSVYAPTIVPRQWIAAGTSYGRLPCQPKSGSSFFLPIQVKSPGKTRQSYASLLDMGRLDAERDALWSAAYSAYLQGRPHEFSCMELAQLEPYLAMF